MEKLKLVFSVKAEEWLDGYDLYYKLYRQKFTYIRAALFAIPLALFLLELVSNPYYTMGWICAAVCLGAIVCIFMNPKLERRNTERALEAIKNDKYELTLTEDKLTLSTIIPEGEEKYLEKDENGEPIPLPDISPTVIDLKDKSLKVIETEKIIGLFSKELSAVVPKSELSVYDLQTLKETVDGVK